MFFISKDLNFEQLFAPLGAATPEGEKAARIVHEALVDMALRCETVVEEVSFRRNGQLLTIAMLIDEIGANQKNIKWVCESLLGASEIRARGHNQDAFWLEIDVPSVYAEEVSVTAELSIDAGTRVLQEFEDVVMPTWLAEAAKAVKAERSSLTFEDFKANEEQMTALVDVYATLKAVSDSSQSIFHFDKPSPPNSVHGNCSISSATLIISGDLLTAMLACASRASSLGFGYCIDDTIRFSLGVDNVYSRVVDAEDEDWG